MSAALIVQRLRRFLLINVALLFAATILELALSEHFQETLQLIPFVLSAAGLLAVGAVWFRPTRGTILTLRGVMLLIMLGSLTGVLLHLRGNFAFELDIRPNAALGDVVLEALTGAAPLLAPGILALGALLAIAATYYHPALTGMAEAEAA